MMSNTTAGKVISCRAAVAWEPDKPLTTETIEVAPPKEGEVRVKILYTGICRTDLFSYAGKDGLKFPMILGHEGAGIVESVGPGVNSVGAGDHVIPSPITQCGKCKICTKTESNLCDRNVWGTKYMQLMDDEGSRFTCRGQTVYHYFGTSTFSEYTVIRESQACKINPSAPLDKVCLIACGVATGFGATMYSCKVKPGNVVGVWGIGAIGLAAIMGAKDGGASEIVAIDLIKDRFEEAKKMGATEYVNPKDVPGGKSLPEYFYEKFDGGLDIAFEATGAPQAMSQAVECTRKGVGQTCILGVSDKDFVLKSGLFLDARTVRGCFIGGGKPKQEMPTLVEKFLAGKLNLDVLISWRLPLEQINEGIEHLKKGEGIRSVVSVAKESGE